MEPKYTKIALVHGELVPVHVYEVVREPAHLTPVFSKTKGVGGKVPKWSAK